ncbi:hypothetical protein C1932_09915 [Stenotrophomonas sp. YAU14D1_LEIMI4_1]|nr:hypothetical protein C1932_09915 [Stenotrophomonas sp. YAU14D1_LEIMI4_1]
MPTAMIQTPTGFTKNQHYVPQFYLKYFYTPNEKCLFATDTRSLPSGPLAKPEQRSARRIAAVSYLYTALNEEGEASNDLETAFSKLEDYCSKILVKFKRPHFEPDENDRLGLCVFVGSLLPRHPRHVFGDRSSDIPSELSRADIDQKNDFREAAWPTAAIASRILCGMAMKVHYFEDDILITSDAPTLIISIRTNKVTHLSDSSACVYFPVNPRCLIVFGGSSVAFDAPSGEKVFTDPSVGKAIRQLIIDCSWRQVFSPHPLNECDVLPADVHA